MKTSIRQTISHWRGGVRLYIAIAIVAVTFQAWLWASLTYAGSNLFAIRLEEVYAWLAVGLITTAVSIGPSYKIFPKLPGKRLMADARRLFGVGGAWFASLHVGIAYISQFSSANPLSLPIKYQQGFAIGSVALLILLAMAFTSFDKALKKMGIWWFRLHRLVYIALLAILAHSFMVGVHATMQPALMLLLFGSIMLLALNVISQRGRPSALKLATITSVVIALVVIFNYGYSQRAVGPELSKGGYSQ